MMKKLIIGFAMLFGSLNCGGSKSQDNDTSADSIDDVTVTLEDVSLASTQNNTDTIDADVDCGVLDVQTAQCRGCNDQEYASLLMLEPGLLCDYVH